MFRAKAFFNTTEDPENAITLHSSGVNKLEDVQKLMESLLNTPNITGGGVQEYIQGIGWVTYDENER